MGDKPVYATKAHVFHINPTESALEEDVCWLARSQGAADVSIFFDAWTKSYKIISIDGAKVILNSTLRPQMRLTRTSLKFGQWLDPITGTVYGLGFASQTLLDEFALQFDCYKFCKGPKEPCQENDTVISSLVGGKLVADKCVGDDSNMVQTTTTPGGDMRGGLAPSTAGEKRGKSGNRPAIRQLKLDNEKLKNRLKELENDKEKGDQEKEQWEQTRRDLKTAQSLLREVWKQVDLKSTSGDEMTMAGVNQEDFEKGVLEESFQAEKTVADKDEEIARLNKQLSLLNLKINQLQTENLLLTEQVQDLSSAALLELQAKQKLECAMSVSLADVKEHARAIQSLSDTLEAHISNSS